MARAVARGLLRRKRVSVRRLGVDETSFQRRHEYVTIVTDLDSSVVLHAADDRKRDSLDSSPTPSARSHSTSSTSRNTLARR